MGTDLTVPDIDDESLGPAMKRCTQLQRRFVLACLLIGGGQHKRAAAMAGYSGDANQLAVTGYRVAHTPYVQQAILEEAAKRLGGSAIEAVNTVLETMSDAKSSRKERLSAAQMILNRIGLHSKTEHSVTVTQEAGKSSLLLEMIRAKLKTNPDYAVPEPLRKMLEAGKTAPVEVEFKEVDVELDALLGIE
jgi:phage terminase small subunit